MTEPNRRLDTTFQIGDWTVDGNTFSVRRGGVEHALEPRAYEVLRYLAERPGRLVTIDELLDECWAGVVVAPNTVARIIAQLRKALEDDARNPRYLETVARKGYRVIGDVRSSGETESPQRRHALWAIAVLLILAGIGGYLWLDKDDEVLSVAVYRFDNYTGDELDYVSDGLAEEVINTLAGYREFSVVSRNLSFRYSAEDMDPLVFAESLDADYYVEGSVRLSGGMLRLTAQLIDANTGRHVLSENFDVDRDDLFAGQDAIAGKLAAALAEEQGLPPGSLAVQAQRAPLPAAYDLYLRGRRIWHLRGQEPFEMAVNYFAESVKVDPEFARGWAALASAYLTWPSYSAQGFATMGNAEPAATKAIELDPALGEPYAVLGTFARFRGEWRQADELMRESIRRNDKNPTVHFWYSDFLAGVGRFNDSFRHLARTMELDPLYAPTRADIAWAHLFWGNPETALAEFRQVWDFGIQGIEMRVGIFWALVATGEVDEAMLWSEQIPGDETTRSLYRRVLVAMEGGEPDPTLIDDVVANSERIDHRTVIVMTAALGRTGRAAEFIRARIAEGRRVETFVLWGPYHKLREAEEFPTILDELALLEFWDERGWGDACRRDAGNIVCDGRDIDLGLLSTDVD